jgi:hypothetical protein
MREKWLHLQGQRVPEFLLVVLLMFSLHASASGSCVERNPQWRHDFPPFMGLIGVKKQNERLRRFDGYSNQLMGQRR